MTTRSHSLTMCLWTCTWSMSIMEADAKTIKVSRQVAGNFARAQRQKWTPCQTRSVTHSWQRSLTIGVA